jgi:hypothetical protein
MVELLNMRMKFQELKRDSDWLFFNVCAESQHNGIISSFA